MRDGMNLARIAMLGALLSGGLGPMEGPWATDGPRERRPRHRHDTLPPAPEPPLTKRQRRRLRGKGAA